MFKCVWIICCHKNIQGYTSFCFSSNLKDADEFLGILTSHFQLVHRLVSYANFRVFPHIDKIPWNRLQNIPSKFVSAHHVSIKKYTISVFLFVFGVTAPREPGPPHSRGFKITHNDASQPVGLLWTSDQPVAETSTWQHTTLIRQTSMPLVGFEPTISAGRAAADLHLRPRGHWDRLW